ncbi:MAG: hypothetical protein GWP91_22165 [Rhodobacterales bacterium]|nr:hypothetical protein [Rhodobacterales bacterium]
MAKRGRTSWRPGDKKGEPRDPPKDSAAHPSTQMMKVSDVKRKAHSKPPPRRPTPRQAEPDDHAGRSLSNLPRPPADVFDAGGDDDEPDGASPFASYAPGSVDLTRAAEVGTESSNQILAIIGGLSFMLILAIFTVLAILMIGIFTWSQQDDGIAAIDDDDPTHIRDTDDIPDIIDIQPRPSSRPRTGGPDAGDPDAPTEPVPITTGNISIEVPKSAFFHSLEINCPDAGISRRANFRKQRASTSGIPIGEECTVTFQGSEPARTTISGGQNKVCITFNPTECRTQ